MKGAPGIKSCFWLSCWCLISIASFFVFPAQADEPGRGMLENITFDKVDGNREVVTFKLNGVHIPKVFAIKGEKPRVVFDFLNTRHAAIIAQIMKTEGNIVRRIRIGIHNGKNPRTRVVIDLVPQQDFDFEQQFVEDSNILEITMFNPDVKDETEAEDDTVVEDEKPASPPQAVARENDAEQSADETTVGNDEVIAVAVASSSDTEEPVVQSGDNAEEATATVEQAAPPSQDEQAETPVEQADSEKSGPVLSSVTFENSSNKGEMVMFKLNEFYPPIVFGIEEDQPRVVCDFLDTQLGDNVERLILSKGNYISKIRTGKHRDPDKVRIVLDLVPNKNYDLQQVFFKEENLFVIIVNDFSTGSQEQN